MKIITHTDFDGICSAAIVYDNAIRKGVNPEDIKIYILSYTDTVPISEFEKNEEIWFTDYSPRVDGDFEKILEITPKVVWIDHHKSEIYKYPHLHIKGIRRDGTAACILTWEYIYGDICDMPKVVDMLGRYDVWDFSAYPKNVLMDLQAGLKTIPHGPTRSLWSTLFERSNNVLPLVHELIESILEKGKIINEYRRSFYDSQIKFCSFVALLDGYKAICCNLGGVGSYPFEAMENDYDLMIPFFYDGILWHYSLFTTKDYVDCSAIAKKFGGGGHKGAAGFASKDFVLQTIISRSSENFCCNAG